MPAAVGSLAVGEHVIDHRQALRLHRLQQQVRDRREIVRLCVKRTVVAVGFLVCLEPRLVVECLCL